MDNTENIEVLNRQLVDHITNSENGDLTKMSSAATSVIRTEIREDGFTRKVLKPKMIGNEDLDRVVEHDRPVVIEEIETSAKGSFTVPFNSSSHGQSYYGPKGLIEFFQVKTPKWYKNINELRTYRHDIRKLITDNALQDMQLEEDGHFIQGINQIVGPPNGVGMSGVQQNFEIQGGISRNTYPEIKKILQRQRLNNGIFLMNRHTAIEFEKWFHDEWGGSEAQDITKKGLVGSLQDSNLYGVPHIFTIKDELVPDNVVYLFTEPGFLGKFYILQDATMYVKKEEDIITFNATETIGVGILNTAGVARVEFVGA